MHSHGMLAIYTAGMTMDPNGFKADVLKQEIDVLVRRIDHFDDLRHQTKQMAATLWLGAVGAALTIPSKSLLWLALGVPIPFWYFDACYNAYQAGFSRRFWAIRAFVRDGKFTMPDASEPTLSDFLMSTGSSGFPVPDYFGNHTFDEREHRRCTSRIRNAFTAKMLLFYGSLTLASLLLIVAFEWLNLNPAHRR